MALKTFFRRLWTRFKSKREYKPIDEEAIAEKPTHTLTSNKIFMDGMMYPNEYSFGTHPRRNIKSEDMTIVSISPKWH